VISTVEVPTQALTATAEFSRIPKAFRPEFWVVDFGWYSGKPEYYLSGPRLTTSGVPYASGQEVDMSIEVDDIPEAARLNLAEQLRARLDKYIEQEEAKIALVTKGVTK
jgi:hypothetical protein